MELLPYHVIVEGLANHDITIMEQGRDVCLAILQHSPKQLACLRLLAEIEYEFAHFPQAEKWFAEALRIEPDSAELCCNYALALAGQKKYGEAIVALQRAVQLNSQDEDMLYRLGIMCEAVNNGAEAILAYRAATQLAPDNLEIVNRLGTVLMAAQELVEAEQCFRHVLALKPDYVDAINNLGNILYFQGEFTQCIALFKQALRIEPEYLMPMGNLAIALEAVGELTEAIAIYRQAIALYPESIDVHVNFSMALLTDGQMEEGWREFEWRRQQIDFFVAREKIEKPLWQGQTGEEQTLLIRAEQGYGDTLEFCRYVPLVAARGWRVIVEVQPPLVRLLQSLPGAYQVIGYGDSLPQVDCYCPMMSLPFVFQTQLATIPAQVPYLTVSPESCHAWQEKMYSDNKTILKVGIVWAGKRRDASLELAVADSRRSMDSALFASLLSVPGIQFYSLQKEGPTLPETFGVVDMMGECNDFADTASVIMNLDLVISVDTAVAHLAGALGKKVWLLNRFNNCWRWLKEREDSPWYPTLRIFRQSQPGDWENVMWHVKEELYKMVETEQSRGKAFFMGEGDF